MTAQIPFVIDHTGHAERSYDIYSRLLEDRIIFLRDAIDDDVANVVIAQMLFRAAKDPFDQSPQARVRIGSLFDFEQFANTRQVGFDFAIGQTLHAKGIPNHEEPTATLESPQKGEHCGALHIMRRRRANKVG